MSDGGERLQRFLARAGVASRRAAESLIVAGRVSVNGMPAELGMRVSPGDSVELDGEPVVTPPESVTYALNKPAGYLTSVGDDRGRATVMGLVPGHPGLHPVGRLDLNSEGLLLLTSDGELTLRLTHPRYSHPKRYRVWCQEGSLPEEVVGRLVAGLELDDGPARATAARSAPGGCELVIEEGRKRQVRRMLEAVGYRVGRLVRTAIGSLELGDLKPGEWRELRPDEIELALAVPAWPDDEPGN